MMRSLFSAVSGLKNHQIAMDVIGNNISNVNTIGFKSSSVVFTDIFSQTLSEASAPTAASGGANPMQIGLGMTASAIKTNIKQGSTQSTGRTLDFSIDGEGYLIVQDRDGDHYYTRNGSLEIDSAGNLVTENGSPVMGVAVPTDQLGTLHLTDYDVSDTNDVITAVKIDPTRFMDYAIGSNGTITAVVKAVPIATDPDFAAWPVGVQVGDEVEIGRILVSTFTNPAGLEKTGNSFYAASANSGVPVYDFADEGPAGSLTGGSLEMSNVDLSNELTNMIIMQRGFQVNSRVITTSDSMLEELVNLKR